MAGYTRNDVSNNIASGNVIQASDLDGEFDAIVAAFNASTGHTHDGTAAEGAAITKTGPAQDMVSTAASFHPKTDSTYELGTTALRWSTGYLDDLVLTNALPVLQGGTGSTTAGGARTSLGLAIGTDVQAWDADLDTYAGSPLSSAELTQLQNIDTTTISIAQWGYLGALAAAPVEDGDIGSTVQAWDAQLDDIAALAVTDSNFIVGNGTNWVVESGATARTSLGLGSIATQAATSVNIDGGNIDGTTIGGTTAAAGTFTALTATEVTETDYNLTGTLIDPANGSIQYKTLSANTTFTESLTNGQTVLLMIDDGTAYTVTWPTITWLTASGNAPTLLTTGYNAIMIFKMNSVLYGKDIKVA